MNLKKLNVKSYTWTMIVLLFLGLSSFNALFAQAQEIRWLRVGSLHSWFSNFGSELEIGRTGRATEQQDGLRWPAEFSFQDCQVGKSMWIGTTNYQDRDLEQVVPHKVASVGVRNADPVNEVIPIEFKMMGRFAAPTVIVDGNRASDNILNDIVDEIDPDLKADRIIINKLHSTIGITITRKMMAFAQPNHDNYFIYEYVFKNTGIIDANGTTDPKTLTDVVFHFQYGYATGSEAFKRGWAPTNNISWGRNTVNQVIGQDPADLDFEFRAEYSWYGPHSQSAVDDWGAPNPQDGRLAGVQYMGNVTLHADKSTTDKSDDPLQPFTTQFIGADTGPQSFNQFDTDLMTRKYEVMSAGHPELTHAEEVGNGFANLFGTDAGGFNQGQGFGPYTMEPGDSIRIVLAEGVSGISRLKSKDVGKNWFDGTNLALPNGSTTNDADEYKRLWVQTGEDSILQTFRRAVRNFNANFDIPQAPPPPDVFEVKSGGDRITLTWSNSAESWPIFNGYRIYRAEARPDTFYTLIFETDKSNLVNSFDDTTPRRGFDYYYYIQSVDDGSTNDAHPGVPMTSSKFYTITNSPAFLRRPSETSLSEIRVVPNPFHIRARDLQFGKGAEDRIAFFGLPPKCTIRIYTERGDLVETIEHTDGSGDELWNSLTSSGQVIVSGLYVVHFQVTEDVVDPETGQLKVRRGESAFRKFIVVR